MLCAAAICTLATSRLARAEAPSRGRVDLRVLGRLDSQPRIRTDGGEATVIGVLVDESGLPVVGRIAVQGPTTNEWTACPGSAPKPLGAADFPVDAGGNYCLRGPLLPDSTRIGLRLMAENHQTRELDLPTERQLAAPAQIVLAPELIDLSQQGTFEVDAIMGSAEPATDAAELFIECGGARTRLARAAVEGEHFHFVAPVALLPHPGSCSLLVRTEVDSSPRAVTLRSPARLRTSGWTTRGARPRATIEVDLEWGAKSAPLTEGMLEVLRGPEHTVTVPLADGGEGILELGTVPKEPLSIRLIRAPTYVGPSNELELTPPEPWAGWVYVQVAGLLGLGAWLVFSWRSGEKKASGPLENPPPRPTRSARPGELIVAGRAVDAHTGLPVRAVVEVRAVGTATQELVATVDTDGDGRFSFALREPGLARLRSTADGYVTFDGPLPSGSPLVRMTQRRRAALSILTGWVRRARGSPTPFETSRSAVPTPDEVAVQARALGRDAVADWARDIARAVYGVAPPTDADLSALDERKPS